ncbi:MAG: hypothetical protein GY710_02800 [Desulfobacteraceae bacterium]|nr:hypothetical protein [Desulfobacteraceae bacterium]
MKLILKKAVGGEETVITENNSLDVLKSFAEKKYSLKKAWINSKEIVYDPQNTDYCFHTVDLENGDSLIITAFR